MADINFHEPDDVLGTIGDWAKWAREWSGSAFIAGDPVKDEAECRGDLYAELCRLGNEMLWLGDKVLKLTAASRPTAGGDAPTFQQRVQPWMLACFGAEIAADRLERNDRFIEEALELVQASGYSKERAHQLVEYVFGRDQGDIDQEVGGVMVTLAAHCLAHGVDMHEAAERELARIWTKVEAIRAKQALKPKGSALPIPVTNGGAR